jgi:hypothetical protein
MHPPYSTPLIDTARSREAEVPEEGPSAVAEVWNDRAWQFLGYPAHGENGKLDAVSCASATSCMAVGSGHAPSARAIRSEITLAT